MKIAQIMRGFAVALLFCLTSPVFAAIQLTLVVTGLSSPTFVTNAGDGSNRLFIVEQGGTIRVLQHGSTTPTLFLDIHAKVVAGGEANDPPNNAQNINVLLGKILRIDVSAPGTYSSPPTNPFFGVTPGADEIFAYGFRNPWRFSFDPVTGVQWVGDVGQGAREEVDMPIVNGGNYGWRVFEGTACTNIDAALCGS